jgi:hypothetical protein
MIPPKFNINIYPEKELREKIEREAKKRRQNMNGLILTILEDYFRQSEIKSEIKNEKIIQEAL